MSVAVRYRLVLDTNVIVGAGSRWVMTERPSALPNNLPSQPVHCVTASHEGLVCEDIMLEYAEMLEYHRHPPERIKRYLGHLAGACEMVHIISFYCEPRPVDPDDTIFI